MGIDPTAPHEHLTSSAAPKNTAPPSISGAAIEGQTLTASVGEWSGRTPMRYAFQWQRAGTSIPGANGSTYALGAGDVGFSLDVVVTASNASGSASATSAGSPVVVASSPAPPPPPPSNLGLPTITGVAEAGQTLLETPAIWTGATASSLQWQRCDSEGNNCGAIGAANGQGYTLTANDVGHEIRVQETASNSTGATSVTSEATQVVKPEGPTEGPTVGLAGFKFIGSIDTMKLSKDQASGGFTGADAQAVDLASAMAVTHITVDTPIEDPSVMLAWAERIHKDGKHVWFRLSSNNGGSLAHADASKSANYQSPYDGYPGFGPGYLTTLHNVMLANPGLVKPGDVLDGDAEAENSKWWAANYGCGVQEGCKACPDIAHMTAASYPCSPVSEFNRFLVVMTEQENRDLVSLGITPCATPTATNCVLTQVHSTDPGTATHQLTIETVKAMGDLITVDAYPDQHTTEPSTAAIDWTNALQSWESAWISKGITVTVLVGEWGYSNAIDVTDSQQAEVVHAETEVFPTIPYLAGTNYWVGPGNSSDGGYTNILIQASGIWSFRPAASNVSALYAAMNGESVKELP